MVIGAEGEEAEGGDGTDDLDPIAAEERKPPVDPESCKAIRSGITDSWCVDTCGAEVPCPEEFCKCSRVITTPP